MGELKVRYRNAECWRGCDDPQCPYTHLSGWAADGIDGLFGTEAEAIKALGDPAHQDDDGRRER